jgi:flagellar motor switch protein FliM
MSEPPPESLDPSVTQSPSEAKATQPGSQIRVFGKGGLVSHQQEDKVQSFDFGASSFLTQRELRRLRELLDGFVDDLTARLSLFLRIEMELGIDQVEACSVKEALSRMNQTTHLSLLRMTPLRGHTVVETPLEISLAMVDRLLGGGAKHSAEVTRLNEVEVSLMDDVVNIIGSEWASLWKEFITLQSSIVSHETNPQYLNAFSLEAPALDIAIKARLGETEAILRMVIPRLTLEPLLANLHDIKLDSQLAEPAPGTIGPDWDERFDTIKAPVQAWCKGPRLTLREIASLKLGQILPFHANAFTDATLRVAGKDAFRGSVGKIQNQWALKVEQKIE